VTILRSSLAAAGYSVSGAVQKPQKAKPSGFSRPQLGQTTICRV
jgi:hypothetical protein